MITSPSVRTTGGPFYFLDSVLGNLGFVYFDPQTGSGQDIELTIFEFQWIHQDVVYKSVVTGVVRSGEVGCGGRKVNNR